MQPRSWKLAVVLTGLAAALSSPPVRAADAIVTTDPTATNVRAFAGVLVWSRADGRAAHRLVQRVRGVTSDIQIPVSSRPLAADLGLGRDGLPALVYERCEAARCAIFRYDFATGEEHPLHGLLQPNCRVAATAVWRTTVVVAQRGNRCAARGLRAIRSGRPLVVPRVRGSVDALDLRANRLAWSGSIASPLSSTDCDACSGSAEAISMGALGSKDRVTVFEETSTEFEQIYIPSVTLGPRFVYWSRWTQPDAGHDTTEALRTSIRLGSSCAGDRRVFRDFAAVGERAFDARRIYYVLEGGGVRRQTDPAPEFSSRFSPVTGSAMKGGPRFCGER